MGQGGQFSDTLMCRWLSWRVVDDHTLRLDVPDLNCTDMAGCLRTARLLSPGVSVILIYAGGKLDTVYKFLRVKKLDPPQWVAFVARADGEMDMFVPHLRVI